MPGSWQVTCEVQRSGKDGLTVPVTRTDRVVTFQTTDVTRLQRCSVAVQWGGYRHSDVLREMDVHGCAIYVCLLKQRC